jgi:hypothetical protein
VKQRPEFKKTAFYVLVGQASPDDLPTVYIGEGDPVGDRLAQHQKLKDFWTVAVFFTSKDDNLNKAHVQYLEAKLVGRAQEPIGIFSRCLGANRFSFQLRFWLNATPTSYPSAPNRQ